MFIRGIGQTDATSAVDPGVGIYVDEVYMGRAVGGVMDFRDLEAVQVLRGPQGTLFGRNTIGGAVLLTTKLPGDEFGGTVRGRFGEDNLGELFAAVNVPLADGLAARVSFGTRQRDGYVTRVFDGQDLGDENSSTFQGSVKWDVSPSFSVIVRGDYTYEDENGSPFVFKAINENAAFVAAVSVAAGCPGATFPPPFVPLIDDPRCANDFYNLGPFKNGGAAPVESTLTAWGISGVAEWEVTDYLSLKSITAYRKLDWTGIRDADNTPFTILTTDYLSDQSQFSEEIQATVEWDGLVGVAGFYYFNEDTFDNLRVPFALPPVVLAGGPGARDLQFVDLNDENWALFTQWTYNITDALSVTGGIRYTDETKGMRLVALTIVPATNPDPDPIPDTVPPLLVIPDLFEENFTSTIGSASIQYRWSPAFMTYGSWSQASRAAASISATMRRRRTICPSPSPRRRRRPSRSASSPIRCPACG